MISRWGDVEQDMVAKLTADLIRKSALLRQCQSGTSEQHVDEIAKAFPSAFVVFLGARVTQKVYRVSTAFASLCEGQYKVIGYGVSGKPDDQVRYGSAGVYAIMDAIRGSLMGFTPPSITDNAKFLFWESETPATAYARPNGTGGLKMEAVFSLEQVVSANVS